MILGGTGILPVGSLTGRMPVPLRIKNYRLFNPHSLGFGGDFGGDLRVSELGDFFAGFCVEGNANFDDAGICVAGGVGVG